ncbi:MAG: helix-turn-helix domain containing protein [Aeromicrobium erythreum]
MAPEQTLTPAARKLLDAAAALFYAEGIHAVGVEAVAARAGVTKKTLYDRFGSKEALVVAYLRERDDRWRAVLEARLAAVDPGRPALEAFWDEAERWSREHGPRGCAAINARAETGDPEHPVAQEVTRQKAWVHDLLRGHVAAAGAADVEATTSALVLLHDGALVESGLRTVDAPFTTARAATRALIGS